MSFRDQHFPFTHETKTLEDQQADISLKSSKTNTRFFRQSSNICLHLFPVSGGLVQSLQPHITQSQHGVCVILCGWLLQNTLKLLLSWTPLLLGQMKVSNQRPRIRVILHHTQKRVTYEESDDKTAPLPETAKYLIDLQSFFEPV